MDKAFWIVIVAGLVTMAIRFAPFLFFNPKKGVPASIRYLGSVLPPAIMGTLIVFAVKHVDVLSGTPGIPEFAGILGTVLLHLWKRNTLLSIAGGTALYMVLFRIL